MKPGYQSTEFYVTLISQVVGLLAMAGVVEPSQSNNLVNAISTIGGAVLSLISGIYYVAQRTWLKGQVKV